MQIKDLSDSYPVHYWSDIELLRSNRKCYNKSFTLPTCFSLAHEVPSY
jgi:hypothetical protein